MVDGFKGALEEKRIDYDNLLQVLDPRRVPVNKPTTERVGGDLDAL